MNMPPLTMQMKIIEPKKKFSLWLPLFIIVPIVVAIAFALFLILLPLIVIAAAVQRRRGFWRLLFFGWPAFFICYGSLRGLEVDIKGNHERVYIAFK